MGPMEPPINGSAPLEGDGEAGGGEQRVDPQKDADPTQGATRATRGGRESSLRSEKLVTNGGEGLRSSRETRARRELYVHKIRQQWCIEQA